MRAAACLVCLAGTMAAATPPLAAYADPAFAIRQAHRRAVRAVVPAPADAADDATFRARLSPQGQRYKLPVVGHFIPSEPDDPPGLLFATRPGAPVIAPMAARVAYAGPFRRYGDVLILDHGHGQTTVLTGLARIDAAQGAALQAGDPLGRASDQVRIQLLDHGRTADLATIAGLVIPQQAPRR